MKNLKKIAFLLMLPLFVVSCSSDDDNGDTAQNVMASFTFTQNWDGQAIVNSDYDVTEYTNLHGEVLTLSKLVYLISDVEFVAADGTVYTAGDYNLIDAKNGTGIDFTPNVEIPEGTYTVRFTFGFDDEDNNLNYADLNSADGGWNVPMMMGGGYHYMRMEGKYTSSTTGPGEVNFQYHTIRAVDMMTSPITLTDTSFEVNLGEVTIGSSTNIEVKMNVAEWFKNPNTWDLTVLYTLLMPNYNAQLMMHDNGSNGVFTLGDVTQ